MASAKVSYGALKTEENNDPNGLKSASFDEEGVEVRTKPSGSRRTILAVVALALVGTALLVRSRCHAFFGAASTMTSTGAPAIDTVNVPVFLAARSLLKDTADLGMLKSTPH
jgi:hypothetical protein